MSSEAESLTKEQKQFLDECKLEFSDRFTSSDLAYMKIYESGIPTPPVFYPWNNRRFNNRERPGSSRNDQYRNRHSPNQQSYYRGTERDRRQNDRYYRPYN
ncbi:unnamed protein product [Acanthoscelides obtectus]|uniref:Uncharacterized protein n=1 Tax=Acanthoscelides obtectus TaxID=200917 RepID=A0A9P0JLZ6_ACAOB|nr:unnamed protein product [Acanthoscelides obtectus]CAK1673739.1 hypothetical protein AOBTE_LOCUS29425 [Acanthoscelides obtectus]